MTSFGQMITEARKEIEELEKKLDIALNTCCQSDYICTFCNVDICNRCIQQCNNCSKHLCINCRDFCKCSSCGNHSYRCEKNKMCRDAICTDCHQKNSI